MAATKARVGKGTTLGYDASSPYSTYVLCAEMVKLAGMDMDFGSVEATHLSSDDDAKEFIPAGFTDYGEVSLDANYYSDEIETLLGVAVAKAVISWQITIPDKKNGTGANTTATFMGFVTKLKPFDSAETDGNSPLRHSMAVKITGKVTWVKSTTGA
jgi:hypothetical protein